MTAEEVQTRVMAALEPYFPRIYSIFINALALYGDEYPSGVRAEHSDRTAANSVYDHVLAGFRREFISEPGFTFLDLRGLIVLNIRDVIVARFKKVNEDGVHRNVPTKQQLDFDGQADIPGLPLAATRVVLGYQPDTAMSLVERVTVRDPFHDRVAQIVEADTEYSWTDITPPKLPFTLKGRRRATGS